MTTPAIGLTDLVVATNDQGHRKIGEETVILALSTGKYYTLNEMGSWVWARLQQPITVAALKQTIIEEFDVHPGRCEADLLKLLLELRQEGLVEIPPKKTNSSTSDHPFDS